MSLPSDLGVVPPTAVDIAISRWRADHPQVPLDEIEHAVDQYL